jgi:hypothetical protein
MVAMNRHGRVEEVVRAGGASADRVKLTMKVKVRAATTGNIKNRKTV